MHHTIVAVDVEGFGVRDGPHQTKVREGLNTAVRNAFERCGLSWDHCHSEDRGDGLLVLVPPDVDARRLVECLPNELAGCLRLHNATADEQARIRLRMVIHSGEIERDRQGYSGPAVVLAHRLLDSRPLKKALRHSSGILALITSNEFFRNVVTSDPAANPGIYRRVPVVAKETRTLAWICLPDHHGPIREAWTESGQHRAPRAPRTRRFPAGALALTVLLLAAGMTGDVLAAVPPDDRCAEPVQLNVTVSAEKARVIRNLAAEFEEISRDDRGCKGVTAQVTVARSADVITALAHGWSRKADLPLVGPEPHVVLPDSSLEYEVAAVEVAGRRDVSLDNQGSVAFSPLVLARSSAGAALNGGGEQPDTWADLLANAQRNPAERIYRPSPVSSGAGLVATVALYSAALGADHLDRATLQADGAPRDLRGVELAVAAGDEGGTLLCSLRQSADAAVLVSEKAVADFNEGSQTGGQCSRRDDAQLDITYPSEGTPYLDHPFVAVTWHERPANRAREQAVHRFREFLTGRRGQDELRRARFRDRDGDIAPYPAIPPERPRRREVGAVDVPVVLEVFHEARKTARVQLLVDVSAAMAEPFPDGAGNRLGAATAAVEQALQSMGDRDEVGLWVFAAGLGGADDHRVLVPVRRGATEATTAELGDLRNSGRPARVSPTLRAAVDSLRESTGGTAGTSDAVLVVADGSREPDLTQLVDHLRASGVPVFLIAFGTEVCESWQWQQITRETGGACHEVAELKDIDEALDSVAAVLWGGHD